MFVGVGVTTLKAILRNIYGFIQCLNFLENENHSVPHQHQGQHPVLSFSNLSYRYNGLFMFLS